MVWQAWALLSAVFAALTAIFAKVGVENINSDFATFIRTVVIVVVLAAIVTGTGQFQRLDTISARTYVFLTLSALATGASWLCYFRALQIGDAARVAPVDKLSVVLVAVFGVVFLGAKLSGRNWVGVLCITIGVILLALKRWSAIGVSLLRLVVLDDPYAMPEVEPLRRHDPDRLEERRRGQQSDALTPLSAFPPASQPQVRQLDRVLSRTATSVPPIF
jgi:transporter family protein